MSVSEERDRGPMVGWRWKRWTRPKVPCVKCEKPILRGLVNIANANPRHRAFRAMCPDCVKLVFAETPPETWGTPDWKGEPR